MKKLGCFCCNKTIRKNQKFTKEIYSFGTLYWHNKCLIPSFKVIPFDKKNKRDEKNAKLLKRIIKQNLKDYNGIVQALISISSYVNLVYCIELPQGILERVLKEVIKKDVDKLKGGEKSWI